MSKAYNKIILAADDFGKNALANKTILALLERKKIQRVSVMINGRFSSEEIKRLVNSGVKLDLHLNFFNLTSTNPWEEKRDFGIFHRLLLFLKIYCQGKTLPSKVKKAWAEQMQKFFRIFGRYPDGINSHEHIHLFPPYFKIALEIAKKNQINYLRFGKKDWHQKKNCVSLIIWLLRKINRKVFLVSKINSSEFLISLDWLKDFSLKHIPTLPSGEIELIVHPERKKELEAAEALKEY